MKSLIVGFTLYVIPCQTGNETDGFVYTNPSQGMRLMASFIQIPL